MIDSPSGALATRINMFRPLATSRGLEMDIHIPAGLQMKADPELVVIVIDTLIHMALKNGCNGKAIISAQSPFGTLMLDILLRCADTAPKAETMDEELALITPLFQQLKVHLRITNPTETSLLFHLKL